MSAAILDILWQLAAWAVGGLGLALVLHGLMTDSLRGHVLRSRHRRLAAVAAKDRSTTPPPPRHRCPGSWGRVLLIIPWRRGCWYDMSAAAPGEDGRALCPECGRRSSPRQLCKARRRYRLAFVGALILTLGLGGVYGREVHRRGWKAVPDALLVLVPFDERAWIEQSLAFSTSTHWIVADAVAELRRRDQAGTLGPWAARHLGLRVRDRYQHEPEYGVDEASRAAYERLESTPFADGLENVPLVEAVAAIARAAGVPLVVDEAALVERSVDPRQRITIPAYGGMTCDRALDWACDRGRAWRAWDETAWTIEEGTVVVSTMNALVTPSRYEVFPGAVDPRTEWLSGVLTGARAFGRVATFDKAGDAAVIRASAPHLIRFRHACAQIAAAAGFSSDAAPAILDLERRLRDGTMIPIEAQDTARTLVHRLRTELGITLSIDEWGLDMDTTWGEVFARDNPVDRTGVAVDPFGAPGSDPEVPPIESPAEALAAFRLPYVHDGRTVVVGLRAPELMSDVAVYRLPERRPASRPPGQPFRLDEAQLRIQAWQNRIDQIIHAMNRALPPVQSGSLSVHWRSDRLLIRGPIHLQVLVAPVVEQTIEEWESHVDARD